MSKSNWAVGYHAINAVLEEKPDTAISLWVVQSNNGKQSQILESAKKIGINYQFVEKVILDKKTQTTHHQGIALQIIAYKKRDETALSQFLSTLDTPLLLVLDQVQDPHNLGACLRTAVAAGVDAVIVPQQHCAPINQTVRKVASGAVEMLPIFHINNLSRTLKSLQERNIWIVGTSDKADKNVYQQDLQGALAIVLGAEGKGMRQLTQTQCDHLVHVPMAKTQVSSLNVSVACGVILFEAQRQRCQWG